MRYEIYIISDPVVGIIPFLHLLLLYYYTTTYVAIPPSPRIISLNAHHACDRRRKQNKSYNRMNAPCIIPLFRVPLKVMLLLGSRERGYIKVRGVVKKVII